LKAEICWISQSARGLAHRPGTQRQYRVSSARGAFPPVHWDQQDGFFNFLSVRVDSP